MRVAKPCLGAGLVKDPNMWLVLATFISDLLASASTIASAADPARCVSDGHRLALLQLPKTGKPAAKPARMPLINGNSPPVF